MKLRLKEQPKEWIKFAVVWTVALAALIYLLRRWGWLGAEAASVGWVLLGLGLAAVLARPRLARPVYRAVMRGSFAVGQVFGKLLLGLFYLVVLTPMALLLRALGKDFLRTRGSAESYWLPARTNERFENLF
jgi:hypothetical protein